MPLWEFTISWVENHVGGEHTSESLAVDNLGTLSEVLAELEVRASNHEVYQIKVSGSRMS